MDKAGDGSKSEASRLAAHVTSLADEGHLSAGMIALCVAVVAASKREEACLRDALGLACAAGMTAPVLAAAGAEIGLSRGRYARDRYDAALTEVLGGVPEGEGDRPLLTHDEARAYFVAHFGSIPERVGCLADLLPQHFLEYQQIHSAVLHGTVLERKDAELILCALNAADYQHEFVAIHAAGAREAGATEGEIASAAYATTLLAGIAAWPVAAAAIVATRGARSAP